MGPDEHFDRIIATRDVTGFEAGQRVGVWGKVAGVIIDVDKRDPFPLTVEIEGHSEPVHILCTEVIVIPPLDTREQIEAFLNG